MRGKWDWILIILILAIGAISLLSIYSVNKNLATNQIVFWLFGLVVLSLISQFDYQNWQKFAWSLYLVSILTLLVLPFVGTPIRGSVRWIDFGVFRFQPSEIVKITSILILAAFYKNRTAQNLGNFILSFLLILPAFILVLMEPDIGNSLSLIGIWLGISLAANLRFRDLLVFGLLGLILVVISYELLAPYQKQRIATFINPNADPLGTGYNIIQSKISSGSGQFFGRGLGRGPQSQLNFLPEAQSDFIFSSISEQLGLLGAGLLLTLYFWMLNRILKIVKYADRFGQTIIIGAISFFLIQVLVNVGMNMGLLPVTGITLPLVSYGGSSLVSTLFLLGIAFSILKKSKISF